MANLSGFEDFSDLLLHVYRLSHEQPLQAFQDEALDALRRVLPFDSSMWGSATPGAGNVFTISQGSRSGVGGRDARRGAQWIALLSTSAATPQTARPHRCPSGWSEIGPWQRVLTPRLLAWAESPCGASEASTHPDCAPTRSPARS